VDWGIQVLPLLYIKVLPFRPEEDWMSVCGDGGIFVQAASARYPASASVVWALSMCDEGKSVLAFLIFPLQISQNVGITSYS
jgi:hypothetical protein